VNLLLPNIASCKLSAYTFVMCKIKATYLLTFTYLLTYLLMYLIVNQVFLIAENFIEIRPHVKKSCSLQDLQTHTVTDTQTDRPDRMTFLSWVEEVSNDKRVCVNKELTE